MKCIKYSRGELVNGIEFICDDTPHLSPSRTSRCAVFKCKCGKEFRAVIRNITSGNTKSCGCFIGLTPINRRAAKHNLSKHPIYVLWQSIKKRCSNENRREYKYYGGRGITISKEFCENFQPFFDYVTSLEKYNDRVRLSLTLDRIDNDGNYERGNLRWATWKEQANNKSNNIKT